MEHIDYREFSQTAVEHAKKPRNLGPISQFNGRARVTGPCGDTMEFWVLVKDGRVERSSFITDGCGSSCACGSMATCLAEGRRIEEVAALCQQDILSALGGLPEEFRHCALLAATALKAACEDYIHTINEEAAI